MLANVGKLNRKDSNGPYSYSRYWTGTSLQLRLTRGIFSNANDINKQLLDEVEHDIMNYQN